MNIFHLNKMILILKKRDPSRKGEKEDEMNLKNNDFCVDT